MGACGEKRIERTDFNNPLFALNNPHNMKQTKEIDIKIKENNQSKLKIKSEKIKKDIKKNNKNSEKKKGKHNLENEIVSIKKII